MESDIFDIIAPTARPASGGALAAAPPAPDDVPAPAVKSQKVTATEHVRRPTVSERLDLQGRRENILQRARLQKKILQLQKSVRTQDADGLQCAQAWGSTQLHLGDEALRTAQDRQVKHKLQFSAHGALKLAYSDSIDSKGASKSHVPIRAAVTACILQQQNEIIEQQVAKDSGSGYLFIERSFDDTPAHLSFGQLAEVIAPIAKYAVPSRFKELAGKSFAECKEVMVLGVPAAQHGVLDLFVEQITVEYGPGRKTHIMIPPRIMLGKKAGYVYNALQTTAGGAWSLEKLSAMTDKFILMVHNGDSASSNRKAMLYIGKESPSHVLCVANRCLIHQLFRSISVVLNREQLDTSVRSLTSVLHISTRIDQLRRAVAVVLRRSFVYHRGLQPPSPETEHRQHSKFSMQKLLLERTIREELANPFETFSCEELRRRSDLLCDHLQGPWDHDQVYHYCPAGCACGGSEEKAFGMILELLYWIFSPGCPRRLASRVRQPWALHAHGLASRCSSTIFSCGLGCSPSARSPACTATTALRVQGVSQSASQRRSADVLRG